jgi:hypothetical protein
MKADRPCILVYNPVSGHGHLDSWNAMFVSLLLDKGWRVLALTPDVPALTSRLTQKGSADSPHLQVLDWNAVSWRRNTGSKRTPDLPFIAYWKIRMFQHVVPLLLFGASYFPYARYRRLDGTHTVADASVNPGEIDYLEPADFAMRVNAARMMSKWKPDLVLNMYLDMYRTDACSWNRFSALNALPWAGIRFVPSETPRESYYALPSLRGMCFLDENIFHVYQDRLSNKVFEYLPDMTETAVPAQPGTLTNEIRRRAAGRKVVFLGGSIGREKNLARWYELIGLADTRRWFFVQIGELHEGTLTPEDADALERIRSSPPENLFFKAEYLPDERVFNDIVVASDILFAVYRDFKISSNMACKAGSFRKPILVSDRYLMGDRVTRYGIGLAVPEDSARKMLEGLISLADNPIPRENFVRFCGDFNMESLTVRLDSFLTRCLHRTTRVVR